MVERKVIVDKVSTFVSEKLNEVLDSNPFSFIIKPYVSRVANNYIGKLDGLLKAIEDKDGKVDIEGILSESIDNLVVAQVKKYPNVFSGVEIGGGTIKINIPSFDKQLVFDYNDIINSYKEANVSSTELYNGIMSLHNVFDYVEKQDNKTFWKSMRKLHESIKGAHFDEEYAKWQVSTMYHTADNGKICKGEIYNYDCAKNVFDKYVRNINSSITVWDVYVAINAQYHDYIRLYSEWFRNSNKNELDNKIIESAITFYFKDEDSGNTKTWNYFKTAN